MKKEDKSIIISQIQETLQAYSHFYITEAQGLNAEQVSKLRRLCNKQDVKMLVVKNTLFQKALEANGMDTAPLAEALKQNSAILFSNTGNVPAKLIKDFSKANQKPVLKAAYVEECLYVGENQLETLISGIKGSIFFWHLALAICFRDFQFFVHAGVDIQTGVIRQFMHKLLGGFRRWRPFVPALKGEFAIPRRKLGGWQRHNVIQIINHDFVRGIFARVIRNAQINL